ncbi:hypothetical protein CAEBREN_10580 [Caenorhabditis brenneri]|uniref:BZIP domain-containing protein n=1 Tax=Caenorhabditis brenneri TaxID=135651 RepID=G0N627_CAEBE|nr:hypothetical protein CAEBREN_10580 [Caenorhabditis brenneri]
MDNKSTKNLDYPFYSRVDDPNLFPGLEPGKVKEEWPVEDAFEEKIDSDSLSDYNPAPLASSVYSFENNNFDRPASPLRDEFRMPEQSGPLVPIPTSDVASSNAPKRRNRTQMAELTNEERREDTLARNRIHSANYVARGKEKLIDLEEKRKSLEAKLNKLKARNTARKAILEGRGIDWQSIEEKIIHSKALKHQSSLQKKEEAVDKLVAELQSIDDPTTRASKPGTIASKRCRTNRKLRTAVLERDILALEVTIEQEEAVSIVLDEFLKEDASQVSREGFDNSNTLHLHQQPLPLCVLHHQTNNPIGTYRPSQPSTTTREAPELSSRGQKWTPSNLSGTGVPLPTTSKAAWNNDENQRRYGH